MRVITRAPLSARARASSSLRTFKLERYAGWFDGSASLSSSECEPLTLPALLALSDDEGRQRYESLSLGYCDPSSGSAYLREAIAARTYSSISDIGRINVCAPQEGIFLAMNAMLRPNDHVVATLPCYQSLTEVARSIGCDVSGWQPRGLKDGAGSAARFDPSDLKQLIRPGETRAVVCNFPHNPTGALPSQSDFDEILQLCDDAKCALFVDEMYRGLEHAGAAATLPAAADAYERGVSLGGMSKAYGLPGLRIGWLASRDDRLMARVEQLKDFTTICPPAPSEALAYIALTSAHDALLARSRALVADGLASVRTFVNQHAERLEWCEPAGGTFAFVGLRGGVDASDYCDALRARARLMLVPSPLFFDENGVPDRVRVTYGRAGMPALLELWGEDLRRNGLSR